MRDTVAVVMTVVVGDLHSGVPRGPHREVCERGGPGRGTGRGHGRSVAPPLHGARVASPGEADGRGAGRLWTRQAWRAACPA